MGIDTEQKGRMAPNHKAEREGALTAKYQIREMEDPVRQGYRDRPRCCQKTKTFQESSAEVAVAAFAHREQESPFMNASRGGGEIRNCLRFSHLQLTLPLGTARAYRAPMQSGAGGCTRTA
jgi:hypothetical protein